MRGELSSQRPATSFHLGPQRPGFQALSQTLGGRPLDCFSPEQMVVGAPVTGTALVSSPLNKELSSFSLESDGVSRGALG